MPDRYDERFRNDPYRDRGHSRDERGFVERAGDEVRSWFGDDEAERRRRMDERERERDRYYGRDRDWGRSSERGWSERGPGESGWSGERWGSDYGRPGVDRPYRYPSEQEGSRGWPGGYGSSPGSGSGYGPAYGSGFGSESFGRPYGSEFGGSQGWRRGGFAGRGPKGYQRSDNRIIEDVCDRLADAPDVDASNIEVKVNSGEVTLAGTVEDRFDKRRAEELIENISGVREVHNNLRVNRGQESMSASASSNVNTGNNPATRR